MRSTKFTFDFLLEDFEILNETWYFEIFFEDHEYTNLYEMIWSKEYDDCLFVMENYGVHDFITEGEDQLFGYDTYEIEPQNIATVMDGWRDFFIDRGYQCGLVIKK